METLATRLKKNPPVKHYRIGEVAHYSGLSRQTVHNYTIMGLISESNWTDGGHRLYNENVFDRLVHIDELKQSRTLREIREIMEQDKMSPPTA
ncbi:MAG: MerR family transcriptional regulator [Phycisphaerae bacterium]|nr:MerR family transcriptional regulator [Phycisphaerae bacterium]